MCNKHTLQDAALPLGVKWNILQNFKQKKVSETNLEIPIYQSNFLQNWGSVEQSQTDATGRKKIPPQPSKTQDQATF